MYITLRIAGQYKVKNDQLQSMITLTGSICSIYRLILVKKWPDVNIVLLRLNAKV